MMASTTATAVRPPARDVRTPRPSERRHFMPQPQHVDGSETGDQNMTAENSVNDGIDIDGDGDGDGTEQQQQKGTQFDGPTPLHKNHGFFKSPVASEGLCNSQVEQSIDASPSQDQHVESPPKNIEQHAEPDADESPPADDQSYEKQLEAPSTPNHNRKSRLRRRTNAAVIEGDASTAFSHYRPVAPLSSLSENNVPRNRLSGSSNRKRGKRRDKRDHNRDRTSNDGKGGKKPKKRSGQKAGSASNLFSTEFTPQTSAQHDVADGNAQQPGAGVQDPIHSMLHADDPILQNYLPQLTFLNDTYYSKVKPYRMGKRNLPPNQIEVILRRRAVKKRVDAQREQSTGVGGAGKSIIGEASVKSRGHSPPPPSISGRPPTHKHSPPRRKLFPAAQQHSPTHSYRKSGAYEDDSTISSTTVSLESAVQPQQQPIVTSSSSATTIAIADTPKEEVVGDTSLGLKLTILQGKVIIQNITALDDGRASPAQLCGGLINPGDIIIAVNGKSLINGTIHNPVSMDRIITVLKPLSQPMDEETREYSREVRLRFVLGEGKPLLHEQKERERRKIEDRERRKRLGLDGNKMGSDPAADLFGIGAFMGVDQHSGMPMFGHLDHHHHHGEDEKEEKKESSLDGAGPTVVVATKVPTDEDEGIEVSRGKAGQKTTSAFHGVRPTVQAQIAHQVQLDRQWIRDRNTSGFFSMNSNAPVLLRPQSPPPDHSLDRQAENPVEARKRLLERSAQTMNEAKSLVSIVETQDRGIEAFEDEDPMEVASRACGTASIRTGASKRRWHRDSVVADEDEPSLAPSAASDGPNFDVSTIRSGESVEACDHRMLIELAANNESWKANVMKRLEGYAEETEKESKSGMHRGSSSESSGKEDNPAMSFDSFLFGGDVTNILGRKKQSLALPPGEMTSMLFDLVELLENGLPNQIFMKDESTLTSALQPSSPDKSVSFVKNNLERNADDVASATDFLLDKALGVWLKSFRPLPWKQRRALWPSHQSGLEGDSMVSSRMDDNETLSLVSGTTAQSRSIEKERRNLRELIEDLELDQETRRETCRLVTFYFARKFANAGAPSGHRRTLSSSSLPKEAENEAAEFVDDYGSYLDIYKCLVMAGKLHSKLLVENLVGVAKYDSQHREAIKALQKAKTILFYEPSMLSALLELLPSISTKEHSSSLDFIALIVSAYPDLQPWCVQEATVTSEQPGDFYWKYLTSLLDHEEGNDAAKQDEALIKEWCSMLCSSDEADPSLKEKHHQSFLHIASRDDHNSLLYHRDLPFLLDISVKRSEFGLALSLANEIVSSRKYCREDHVLSDVLQHLCIILDKAIEGNEGEINTVLLGQIIAFLGVIPTCLEKNHSEFNTVAELENLLEKCYLEHQKNSRYSSDNIGACISAISENASPGCSLQVLSRWEHTPAVSSPLIDALHTSLIRGAREGVRSELSGSLLRIQRAREEGRRPIVENGLVNWNIEAEELDAGEQEEAGGFIWPSVLDGTLEIAK